MGSSVMLALLHSSFGDYSPIATGTTLSAVVFTASCGGY
jgi:hypothetical protein